MVIAGHHRRSAKIDKPSTLTRHFVLAGILGVWMFGLVGRLYFLQIVQYVDWLNRAQKQQQRTVEMTPQRGTIFDRGMHPLAMSLAVDSVYAVPAEIPNPAMVTRLIAPILGLDAGELLGRFSAYRSFCWIKRKVSTEEASRVRELSLKGVYLGKEMKRFYPKGELAAHVLGAVGLDDGGLAGLEFSMDKEIQGRAGRMMVAYDARGQSYRSVEREGEPGNNVVLTLDESIQYFTEKALVKAVARWRAAWGTAIVQDPNTGEILALANVPTFNPSDYSRTTPQARINRAVGVVYEPGSTFKLVPVSAALEEKLTSSHEIIDCQQGSIVLSGHVIHDHKPFGGLTVEQVVAQSSDVGAIKLGLRLGQEMLHRYARSFGFGSKTEVELPGEERGLLKAPAHWSGISIGEISMGQEVAVTSVQLVTAYSAIANGGILYEPRTVREVFRGTSHATLPPAVGRRVVSERTAAIMRQMFKEAVATGTGAPAQLTGYTAAGKTGTAQKIDDSGRYSKSSYVSSFVGFAPATHPAVTILVVLDSAAGATHAGAEVAAPVFRSIAEQTLGYLSIPHDNPSKWLQVASRAPARPSHEKRGSRTGFPMIPEPAGAAASAVLPVSMVASSPVANGKTMVLDSGPLLTVPRFASLTVRSVARECQRLGLDLRVAGTGLAVEQNPPPGSHVPMGAQLWVRFAR